MPRVNLVIGGLLLALFGSAPAFAGDGHFCLAPVDHGETFLISSAFQSDRTASALEQDFIRALRRDGYATTSAQCPRAANTDEARRHRQEAIDYLKRNGHDVRSAGDPL